MCDFCDKIKYNKICQYDNFEPEWGKDRQHFGINSRAYCGIIGNMLTLDGAAHRYTRADEYYGSWGLDADGEWSSQKDSAILKINFCPFCGKKLTDKTYEKEFAKRELPIIEKQLDYLKYLKSYYGCVYRFQTYEEDINNLKDVALMYTPVFSKENVEIICHELSRTSKYNYEDYKYYAPTDLRHKEKYQIPYSKDLFFNIDKKDFQNEYYCYKRDTGILILENIKDVEELLSLIKPYNKKWKWNKDKILNDVNAFHESVINKINELKSKKNEIKNSLK